MREDQWKHDRWMGCRLRCFLLTKYELRELRDFATSYCNKRRLNSYSRRSIPKRKFLLQKNLTEYYFQCRAKISLKTFPKSDVILLSGPSPINSGPDLDLAPPRPGYHRAWEPPAWWARHPQDPQDPGDLGGPRNPWDGEKRHWAGELDQDGRLHGGHLAVHLDLDIYIVPKRCRANWTLELLTI